jgi:hypothetical protein
MTLVFRYTDATNVNSISGTGPFGAGTPFQTGTARTRPTTRQGIFDELALALVAAGWTEVAHVASTRHVYKSNGEDTTENINIELNLLAGRYLHFNIGTKVDVSDELEARIGNNLSTGGGSDANGRWDLGTVDVTTDFFILVTKDHLFAFFQEDGAPTATALWVSIGIGKRTNVLNPNKYAIVNSPVAGDNVLLDVTPSNPLADGYRPGGIIDIVEVAPVQTAKARRLLLTEVTTTGFRVAHLPLNFAATALVGAQPSPLFRGVSNNELPDDPTVWSSPLDARRPYAGSQPPSFLPLASQGEILATANLLPNGLVLSEIYFASNPGFASSGEYGAGGTPNQRTQRFTCRNIALASPSMEIALVHPVLLAFPATVGLYPHDWFNADRFTPNQYYVGFKPTSSTTERWGVGPTS